MGANFVTWVLCGGKYPPHQPHIFYPNLASYLWRKNRYMISSQKQAAMFARVDEWKKSGKTMREFATGIGLSKSCFEYWIRKKRDMTGGSPQFVELIPSGKPVVGTGQPSKSNDSTTQAQIVFTFPGGLCVKVYG